MQTLLTQLDPESCVLQLVLHAPQFVLLFVRFVQVPEQFEYPEAHTQALLTQLDPEIWLLQLVPHAPQFVLLLVRFVHVPEHMA